MKERSVAEEEATTDTLIKFEKIPILGSACTLHYRSQETHRTASKILRSLQGNIRTNYPRFLALIDLLLFLVQTLHPYTYISLHGYKL